MDIVLVSMGARGILMVAGNERWLAIPPKVKVVNTIGAGDSAVAGFFYGWIGGKPLKESLALAVPAGIATKLKPGTALSEKADVMRLFGQVEILSV